ncbi:MAG: hypothetical protein JWQ42_3052 [Edaphobacter sp.]|jgi:uncharacterized SAM-binding protein YcdF (DUF218 family)|nr:hypothetical protein [Edaphobacter sp.]
MTASAPNQHRKRHSFAGSTLLRWLFALFLLVTLGWSVYVYQQIDEVANEDQAQRADAIAVFGAAEYSGRPSPVLHLRLDHAVDLYRKQIAPLVITLGGGSDKDSGNTEGAVGRDYLLANGIPFGNIIAETRSIDTEQQVHRLAAIARENNLHHIVVVSDATHLFRIRELCKDAGLDVYTSPRATIGHISNYDQSMRYFHEILSYTSLRLGLDISWLHRWLEGKEDLDF